MRSTTSGCLWCWQPVSVYDVNSQWVSMMSTTSECLWCQQLLSLCDGQELVQLTRGGSWEFDCWVGICHCWVIPLLSVSLSVAELIVCCNSDVCVTAWMPFWWIFQHQTVVSSWMKCRVYLGETSYVSPLFSQTDNMRSLVCWWCIWWLWIHISHKEETKKNVQTCKEAGW